MTGHEIGKPEAAGLVPLVADDPDAQLACGIGLCLNPARGRDAEGYAVCVDHMPAAPAPLDPGNPEHLWQLLAESYREAAKKAREAERDRKDRELAAEIAKTERHDFGLLAESYREEILCHILAGIRAGRAERQEAGQ